MEPPCPESAQGAGSCSSRCSPSRLSADDVLRVLESEDFPESRRRNVRVRGDKSVVQGMCLGITFKWQRGPWLSSATRKHSRLASLLCRYARQEIPGVQFSSIQVNKDYRAALHVDKNNLGPSWIIGLGDYSGGRLWIEDGGRAGRAVDIRGQWFKFDGNKPHCVLPFQGRRYTMVFFTYCHPKLRKAVAPWVQTRLEGLGFPLPPEVREPPPRKLAAEEDVEERLREAHKVFKRFQTRVAARGGVDNVLLRVREPCGRIHRVGVVPELPLRVLLDALRNRICHETGEDHQAIHLALDSLRLLPGDTVDSLGLDARPVMDVLGSRDSTTCICGKQLHPQGLADLAKTKDDKTARDASASGALMRMGEAVGGLEKQSVAEGESGLVEGRRGLKRPFDALGA